jgi:hypothetical protein
MPRLVRRRPLSERIISYLNPYDFLLWLSEEFEGGDWEQLEKNWALPIGIALNLVFLIARANSRSSGSKAFDDVFGDDDSTSLRGWLVSESASTACSFFILNRKLIVASNRPLSSSISWPLPPWRMPSIRSTRSGTIACSRILSIPLRQHPQPSACALIRAP